MGIQDRDYMRDRHRQSAFGGAERRDSPFTPPPQRSSMVSMVLTWVAIAFLLYRGFMWFEARQHTGERGATNTPVVTNIRPREARAQTAATPNRTEPPQDVTSQAAARNDSPVPKVRYLQQEEVQREAPAPQTGGTVYLCRAYNDSTFWSQAHCGQHHALIERIVSVPAGLPFEQQVHLGEQQRRAAVPTVYNPPVQVSGQTADSTSLECKALDAEVDRFDVQARQPQSGQMQDWIRGRRQAARDRQFALHC